MSSLRRALRSLTAVVFVLIALTLFSGPAAATPTRLASSDPVAALQLPPAALVSSLTSGDSGTNSRHEAGAATTTPAPTFNQQVQNANSQTAQHKLAVGVTAVVLLVIVYFGRRIRNRHNKKMKGTTS